jgi:hypothetical protein
MSRYVVPVFALLCAWLPWAAGAQTYFTAVLNGAQENPPVATAGSGFGRVTLNAAETQILVSVYYSTPNGPVTAGHIHGPPAAGSNAGVVFNLAPTTGVNTGQVVASTFAVTATQVGQLKSGLLYINIHSSAHPGGEIRGQILPHTPWIARLNSQQEVPPNGSAAFGTGVVSLSPDESRILVSLDWSGLSGPTTAGHIHEAPAGTNGGVAFNLSPPAAAAGSVIDLQFVPTAQQVANGKANGWYFNLHTAANPGGEIRGQIIERILVDGFE